MKGPIIMANKNLTNARKAKNDEFYTQWSDIEKEVNAYLEFDENVFRDKTILLPADDPFESNFFKFFATHFNDYGLKKLIATSYDPSPIVNTELLLSLFDDEKSELEQGHTQKINRAYKIELTDVSDFDNNGRINIQDVEAKLLAEKEKIDKGHSSEILAYLQGDPVDSVEEPYSAGDFRSKEVTTLKNESDLIITNPPFSLFREFLAWVNPLEKQLLVLGGKNAITYKEVFPLIRANNLWTGVTGFNQDLLFIAPEGSDLSKKPKTSIREVNGITYLRSPAIWFTNLDHGRRHQPLALMTMEDNVKYSKHKQVQGHAYNKYDNYNAIEVPFTDSIPRDFPGVMGVPISFLDKYSPEQFEILGTSDNGQIDNIYKTTNGLTKKFVDDYYAAGGKGSYKEGNPTAGLYLNGVATMIYKRIFIRRIK